MSSRIALMVLLGSLTSAANARYGVPLNRAVSAHNGNCALYGISLVQLLANPDKYDGSRVRLTGFIHLEADNDAIYLHREDEEFHLRKNGIRVALSQGQAFEGCQDAYVLIEGPSQARTSGRMSLWSGALTRITRCQKIS